jgi:hypothetical protein
VDTFFFSPLSYSVLQLGLWGVGKKIPLPSKSPVYVIGRNKAKLPGFFLK